MNISKKIHLRDGEDIVGIIRPYPLTAAWLYVIGFGFLAYTAFFTSWLFGEGWWGKALFILGIFAGSYTIFHTWFFNQHNFLIITTHRIADVSRRSWFDETISAVGYADLKDVAVRRRGMLANIFNYGVVVISTPAENYLIEVERVRQPEQVQNLILSKKDAFHASRHLRSNEDVYQKFLKIINELSEAELTLASKNIHDRLSYLDSAAGKE